VAAVPVELRLAGFDDASTYLRLMSAGLLPNGLVGVARGGNAETNKRSQRGRCSPYVFGLGTADASVVRLW
jgi:hypothetical protein